jgi:hypothetical protein
MMSDAHDDVGPVLPRRVGHRLGRRLGLLNFRIGSLISFDRALLRSYSRATVFIFLTSIQMTKVTGTGRRGCKAQTHYE